MKQTFKHLPDGHSWTELLDGKPMTFTISKKLNEPETGAFVAQKLAEAQKALDSLDEYGLQTLRQLTGSPRCQTPHQRRRSCFPN